jgi:hypothetical protein
VSSVNKDSTGQVEPIFVTVADAAVILGLKPWSVYQLLKADAIKSVKQGGRRSVSYASLREYADNLLGESA